MVKLKVWNSLPACCNQAHCNSALRDRVRCNGVRVIKPVIESSLLPRNARGVLSIALALGVPGLVPYKIYIHLAKILAYMSCREAKHIVCLTLKLFSFQSQNVHTHSWFLALRNSRRVYSVASVSV